MDNEKTVIGIMPLWDDDRNSIWMLPEYQECITSQNAVPVILPLTDDSRILEYFADICDGFLLTGGHDVDPEMYLEEKTAYCGQTSLIRDKMDKYILEKAIEKDKAVLGICRGIQLINAALGGTLYQDLPSEYKSNIEHHMTPPYDRTVHKVTLIERTPIYDLLRCGELNVNSYHHQAIKDISSELKPMAISQDGLTEAVYMPEKKFIWGVQWHPEFLFKVSEENRKITAAFISASSR